MHHPVHRPDPGAFPVCSAARPGHQAAHLRRRGHGQRLSRCETKLILDSVFRARAAGIQPHRAGRRWFAPAVSGHGRPCVLAVGSRARTACLSPTRPSATPTSRCWQPGCARATCSAWPRPTRGSARTFSRSRCGAAPPSTRPCGFSRKTRGSGWPSSARRSPTSCSRC